MRTLLLLRGCPASGKSTWVEQNNLQPYTLSADNIRTLLQSPVLNTDGNLCITQNNDGEVWNMLYDILEKRMQRGEFIVVDSTHYRSELIQRYKKLVDEYRYRTYIVDFTDVSKEECLERNSKRTEYKRVPPQVIEKMCAVFDAERDGVFKEVSNKYKILKPDTALQVLQESLLYDLNEEYDNVVIFGDIHGCFEPLKTYFEGNPINERTEYIFVGDYLDRGIQNKEVLDFVLEHINDKNFLFLEGNHELWLRKYCSKTYKPFNPTSEEKKILKKYCPKGFISNMYGENIRSNEFLNNTVPQIESIDKSKLRQICRKMAQFTYFKLGDFKYFVCHGALPCLPNLFISTQEMIKGVGKYEDLESVYKAWHENTEDVIQIHGHRNLMDLPIINNRCVNLCDTPELGGHLRIVEISKGSCMRMTTGYQKNDVYNPECKKVEEKMYNLDIKTDNELLHNLNTSKWVKKKVLSGGIVSYNFTRDAFYKQHWDDITCKARGLFVDAKTEKVVTRSYDKFFNWGQTEQDSTHSLKKSLRFPVRAFKKENGFLGLISYDNNNDKLMFFSKSTNEGDYAHMVEQTFYELYADKEEMLKQFIKEHDCTLIFECIRPVEDAHIIKYDKPALILLDIVKNSFEAQFLLWEDLQEFAKNYGLNLKKLEHVFTNFDELHEFKSKIVDGWDCKHEGYVLEDVNLYRVKLKSRYYSWWKQFRSIKDKITNGQNIKKVFTSEYDVKLYQLLLSYDVEKLKNMSIIDVQDDFYNLVSV